jgi:hypothetical protein
MEPSLRALILPVGVKSSRRGASNARRGATDSLVTGKFLNKVGSGLLELQRDGFVLVPKGSR